MSQISSSHLHWSPNSVPFPPLPSSRALFQRFPQQASYQSKPSVSDSTLTLQRFGRRSGESTGASEERVCGEVAEPTKPAVLGGYLSILFPSSAELFLSRPEISIPFNSLITVLDAVIIVNQTHSH
ncbi:hypothetical protein Bca4012_025848 [Brassica carinata]